MVTASEKLLLRVDEAAERLGLSRSFLYELLAAGRLRGVKIGAARRIPASELERFVETLKGEGERDSGNVRG